MSELDAIQLAAQAQFSKQSTRYGKGHILEDVTDVREALENIPLPVPSRVLDVASGAGHTGLYLASLGHNVTMADLSPAMLERCREAALERALTVETRQHSAEKMPYAEASFDLVTCRVAPHHFSSPTDFLHEVARVLRPGGWFLLIDGTVPDDFPAAGQWLNAVEKWRDPSHVRLLAPAEWTRLCTEAGLTVKKWWLRPKLQPDLEWYFAAAATPEENRREVRALLDSAPERVREIFHLREKTGRIEWQWPILTLIAAIRRPGEFFSK